MCVCGRDRVYYLVGLFDCPLRELEYFWCSPLSLSVIKHACILLARSQARSLIAAGTWGSPALLRGERKRERERMGKDC